MRGEVFLLSRNIKIQGEDFETWGGQIVVIDYEDTSNGLLKSGYLWMDEVQVYNCSQMDTAKAALRFEWNLAHTHVSIVKNSAFHHGNGWGLNMKRANNVEFYNNLFYSFSTIGSSFDIIQNVVLDGNTVSSIFERDFE